MGSSLIDRISEYVIKHPSSEPFPVVSIHDLEEAEKRVGFQLPDLLKAFYTTIGNGYSGSWCDIIGLSGGKCFEFGDVFEAYQILKDGQEYEGRTWNRGLLPFCDWGCNIFSCVDCTDPEHPITTFEDYRLEPQNYSLNKFFEWWCADVDILSQRQRNIEAIEFFDPITKERGTIYRKKRPGIEP